MDEEIEVLHPRGRLLRAALRTGFLFFLAKGCAWLLAAAALREAL